MKVEQLLKETQTQELIKEYAIKFKNTSEKLEAALLDKYTKEEKLGKEVTHETISMDLAYFNRLWGDEDPAGSHTQSTAHPITQNLQTPVEGAFDLSQINLSVANEISGGISTTIAKRLGSLQYLNQSFTLPQCPFVQAVPSGLEIRYTEQNRDSAIKLLKALRNVEGLQMESNLRTGSQTHPHCVFINKADLPIFLNAVGFLPQNIHSSIRAMYENTADKAPQASANNLNKCVMM